MVAPIFVRKKVTYRFDLEQIALILLTLMLSGCSISTRTDNAVLLSLKNRGAVPLSSHNPFIAGNLLLTKEMERSQDLRGFIDNRGTPKAIEISKGWTGPATMQLYYLDKGEYYTAEESGDTWLVTGPSRIPSGGIKLLEGLVEPGNEKAALSLESTTTEAKEVSIPEADTGESASTPTWKDKSDPISETRIWKDPLMPTILALKDKVSEDAEISPRGDVVHYVTYQGETLSMISRWYTLDVRNVGRIARINNISKPSELDIGDTVILPSYLVKNKHRLTEEVLNALLRETKIPKS